MPGTENSLMSGLVLPFVNPPSPSAEQLDDEYDQGYGQE
jgi:hypothetical protein